MLLQAEPRTPDETATLVSLYPSLLPTDFVWFGLSDRDEEAVYRWTSDLEQMVEEEYNNWYQGELEFRQEPDGGTSENCIIAQVCW